MSANAKIDAPWAAGEKSPAVSDQVLSNIAEQGFFRSSGSLADARAACAELLFARAMIRAQTDRIAQLDRFVRPDLKAASPRPLADVG